MVTVVGFFPFTSLTNPMRGYSRQNGQPLIGANIPIVYSLVLTNMIVELN